MAVSDDYREFALEQLGRVAPVTYRKMFGGVGVYSNGFFFALMDNDSLYFKVDDSNRGDFESRGMGPFMPFGDDSHVMGYYEVPAEVIEDTEILREWMTKAVQVARSKSRAGRAK
jgi:DNA transformation protein and related proteins